MQVHRILGNGFQEVIYQRSLSIEMVYEGLSFEREKEMPIFLKRRTSWYPKSRLFCRKPGNGGN
jgi:GxxExxY protein